jgi:predicted PurR-regulated permease PerM
VETSKEIETGTENTRRIDFLIRVLALIALGIACIQLATPFFGILLSGVILAVALKPAQVWIAARMNGRAKTSAFLLGGLLLLCLIIPAIFLVESLVVGGRYAADVLRAGDVTLPPLPAQVSGIPVIGKKIAGFWLLADTNLAAFVQAEAVPLRQLGQKALVFVTSGFVAAGQFALSTALATFVLIKYETFITGARQLGVRLAGARGPALTQLSEQTIRSVALGVMGVAVLQALLTGLGLLIAGVPFAGLLALVALVLCVVQLGPALVLVTGVIWLFYSGHTVTGAFFTGFSIFVGILDNVLKPLFARCKSSDACRVFGRARRIFPERSRRHVYGCCHSSARLRTVHRLATCRRFE